MVEKARRNLFTTGFEQVEVVHGDGAFGHPPGAPYDRVVATVGLPDIPSAWAEQLEPGGKIVVPLHLTGEPQDHELVRLGPRGGRLEGVGLCSLQMVLFRGETSERGDILEERRGNEWRRARVDELSVAVYPADADVPLGQQQKHIRKRGSLTVLGRLKS